jgi:glycosyltransferase involved in cell wall biosynthesis
MRILIANTRHYRRGGDSTYTFGLAEALRSADHEVGFFAMAGGQNEPDPNQDLFVSYIDFRELNRKKSLTSGLQVLRRSIFSSEAEEKFTRLVDRFQPDVVHLQNIHAHLTPSIVFAASRLGVPVVWTMHDYKLMCPNSHFRNDETGEICEACRPGQYHWALLKRCKKDSLLASGMAAIEAYAHWARGLKSHVHCFLSPSRFLAERLLEHGWPSDRVRHVPNFIAADASLPPRGEGSHFLFVGKLEELKGIETLLDAAAHVKGARVLLVGECDDPGIRERLGRLPANVRYLGPKTKQDISALLADARALVIPSLWYENQPMVILEAFAAGVPVIGSCIGGIPELVTHKERGLLVETGSAIDLANAITQLQREPAKARTFGLAAREYALAHHSVAGHLETISEIYHRAVESVERPRAAVTERQPSWI